MKTPRSGARVSFEREIGLEARRLPAVGVPLHLDVHEPEVVAVEDDHARAGAEDRPLELRDRRVEPVEAHEPHERRRLAAGHDEPIEAFELGGLAHLHDVRAQPPQHRRVLAEVALHREDADSHASKCMDGARPARRTSCCSDTARDAFAGPSYAEGLGDGSFGGLGRLSPLEPEADRDQHEPEEAVQQRCAPHARLTASRS